MKRYNIGMPEFGLEMFQESANDGYWITYKDYKTKVKEIEQIIKSALASAEKNFNDEVLVHLNMALVKLKKG